MLKECHFTEESLRELLAFLAILHPRGGANSCWAALPETCVREIAFMLRQPVKKEFVRWDPMAVTKESRRLVAFGLRLRQPTNFFNSTEGIAVLGEAMPESSGLYELKLRASNLFSQDGFCRADVGVIVDVIDGRRLGSGIWWEAGDGDVYVAQDAGGQDGVGGWICDEAAVENGVLPKWDDGESVIGMVLDTHRCRLGFTRDSVLLPFEITVPRSALPLHFAVGWSADTAGMIRIDSWRRLLEAATGAISTLLVALRSFARQADAAAAIHCGQAATQCCMRAHSIVERAGALGSALGLAELDNAPRCRDAVAAAFAQACGGFSHEFTAIVLESLKLRSVRERTACDLAAHALEPDAFEQAVVAYLPNFDSELREVMKARLIERRLSQSRLGRRLQCWRWLRSLCWCDG